MYAAKHAGGGRRGGPPDAGRRHPFTALVAGAALLLIAGTAVLVYALAGGSGDYVLVGGATIIPATVKTTVPTSGGDPAAAPMARSEPVRVQIPALNVSAPVVDVGRSADGTVQVPPLSQHNLTGWYKYGPTPGQRGSSVILGHVDSYTGISVFYYIKTLSPGDKINVTLADGSVAKFAVDGVQNASKEAFPTSAVYGRLAYPGLRLVTCGGPFNKVTRNYLDNIIVYAHLIAGAPA